MRRRRRWLLIIAAPVIVLLAFAYQLIEPRSHLLFPPRASNGVEYVLYAHVPERCRDGGCPAVYLPDGERWIPSFAKWDDALTTEGAISPVIVVGIGYRDIFSTRTRRKLDFTPSFGRAPGRTGGADAYLRVLREDIIPYAEEHLPIAQNRRVIAGHSYAGLFATYALMTAPDLFDGYIIMSPALWFDDGRIFAIPFTAAEGERRVFLAADLHGTERGAMANDVIRLNRALLAQPRITVSRSLLPNTTHDTMVDPSSRAGLAALFGR